MFQIELVFAHRQADGTPLAVDLIASAEEAALVAFADHFRGGRIHRQIGSYRTKDGRTLVEACSVARSDTPDVAQHLAAIAGVARHIAHILGQETVLLTVTRVEAEQHWIEPSADSSD